MHRSSLTTASPLQAIAEINQQTGSSIDPNTDANSLMQQTTQGLMAAVSQLPKLLERKRTIEKHTNLLHNLLRVGFEHPQSNPTAWADEELSSFDVFLVLVAKIAESILLGTYCKPPTDS